MFNTKQIPCMIIVGKPGAGKSSIGNALANSVGGKYISVGGFIREVLGIPDPHIGVDKFMVFQKLREHLVGFHQTSPIIMDCHPYPSDYFDALNEFIENSGIALHAVVKIDAEDTVALQRLTRRPRPGQTYEERLKYYRDNEHYIDKLMLRPNAIVVKNNLDFEDENVFDDLAKKILEDIAILNYV